MSLKIDFSFIPSNIPSICIPYVFETISHPRIMCVFREMNIGIIEQIEKKHYTAKDGRKVCRVFIHLNWKIDEKTDRLRTELLCGKEIIITYDNPWFWKISAKQEIIKNSLPIAPTLTPILTSAPTLITSAPTLITSAPTLTSTPTNMSDMSSDDEGEYILLHNQVLHNQEPEFNVKEYTSKFPSSSELPKKKKRTFK
jgi:hypothetical protein